MRLWQIARQNLRHQGRRYTAFFLSSTFAVWMFFLYASLLFHPEMAGAEVSSDLVQFLLFLEGVVAVFALLFVRFAHTAFLKARMRELATWKLLGMAPRHLAGLITLELITMGAGAILAGIGLGLVFLRFFLLAMSRLLIMEQPFAFYLSGRALGLTLGGFLLLFGLIALLSRWILDRMPVAGLFRSAAQPREAPRHSRWGVLAGAISLAAAYGIAFTFERNTDDELLLWLLLFLILGTYFLFTHGSLAIVAWLKRRPALYLRGTNLLIISQFRYKLRDNARLLFMITILTTFSLTATGLWYASYDSVERQAQEKRPVHLEMAGNPGGLTPERVEAVLGGAIVARGEIPSVGGFELLPEGAPPVFLDRLMPLSAFNTWLTQNDLDPITLGPDGAALLTVWNYPWMEPLKARGTIPSQLARRKGALGNGAPVQTLRLERLLSLTALNRDGLLVLPDPLFEQAAQGRTVETVYLWKLDDWQRRVDAVLALEREVKAGWPPDQTWGYPPPISGTGLFFHQHLQVAGFLLMIGAFLGLLFLLASGNMLYFKLFTDLMEERLQFHGLARVGIRPAEVRRVVSIQTLLLFLLPLAVALVHTLALVRMVRQMAPELQLGPIFLVAALYTGLFLAYWAVTRRTYVAALLAPHQ